MKQYRDHYFQKAKKENYPARSVYKLKEMDKSFRFLQKGQKILDLGACPGSWTLFAAQRTGPQGRILAADLNVPETKFPSHVCFVQEDVFEQSEDFKQLLAEYGPFDVVLSDMAPKTTGIKITDQARSLQLAEQAFIVACENLTPGGTFVVKIFEGPDTPEFAKQVRVCFDKFKRFKPKSSRAESKEIFWLGLGFKA